MQGYCVANANTYKTESQLPEVNSNQIVFRRLHAVERIQDKNRNPDIRWATVAVYLQTTVQHGRRVVATLTSAFLKFLCYVHSERNSSSQLRKL